jgi:hypothetical protein
MTVTGPAVGGRARYQRRWLSRYQRRWLLASPRSPCRPARLTRRPPDCGRYPVPGGGQVVDDAGQGTRHLQNLALRTADDLQVHAMLPVLAGVERSVGSRRRAGGELIDQLVVEKLYNSVNGDNRPNQALHEPYFCYWLLRAASV